MSCKRLSVIIPGYNNPERWWRRCVESVLRNIGASDEVLLVDDGSISKPLFLDEYATDSRVRVIYREENGGLSVARNTALDVACGEFVAFVDSDDEITDGIYEFAISKLNKNHADIAVFGVRSIWVAEKLFRENIPDEIDIGVPIPLQVRDLFENRLLNYVWNKVYRKDFLERKNLRFHPEGMPCEDIIFVLECLKAGSQWVGVPQVGINYYRTHGTLLASYKSSYVIGNRLAADAWKQYSEYAKVADDLFLKLAHVTEKDLIAGEWDNIWRLHTPFSLKAKWRFLKAHEEIANLPLILYFAKKMLVSFLRKYCYIAPIQRWHVRRIYHDVEPLSYKAV